MKSSLGVLFREIVYAENDLFGMGWVRIHLKNLVHEVARIPNLIKCSLEECFLFRTTGTSG